MSTVLDAFFNNRTPETQALYNAYKRGEVDIYGYPKGTPASVSIANPNITSNLNVKDTSVIGGSPTPTTTTSPEPTTASPQPSGDVSSPTMLTEAVGQSQASTSVTDDTTSYENRYNKDRKSTRLNSSHVRTSRMPSSA